MLTDEQIKELEKRAGGKARMDLGRCDFCQVVKSDISKLIADLREAREALETVNMECAVGPNNTLRIRICGILDAYFEESTHVD
jgi:hypothetical protein